MRRTTGLAMATLMLLLGATACGSDGDSDAATEATTTTAGDGGTTTDGSDDGGSDDGGSDVGLGLIDEDCQFLLAGVYLNPLASLIPGVDADVDETSEKLEALVDKAPEEIQDAVATVSEANAELAQALEGVDLTDVQSFTDPDLQQTMEELESTFDDDYEQAAQTLSDYATENCTPG